MREETLVKLTIKWHPPLLLRKARPDENLFYACDDLELIPSKPGIYVFARRHGQSVSPLYIGQSLDLHKRIRQHLEGNVGLLKGILRAEAGQRLLLIGEAQFHPGQKAAKVIKLLERVYIEHALTAGYDLLNEMGTKTPSHNVQSQGKKEFHAPFPRHMNLKIK